MPYSDLILTGGISALSPRNLIGAELRKEGSPLQFLPNKQNPEPRHPEYNDSQIFDRTSEFVEAIINSAISDPKCISAEFSMLHAIYEKYGFAAGAVVTLIHTPTLGGRLSAKLQIPLIEKAFKIQCLPLELDVPFDPAQPGGLALASGAFIGTLSKLLTGTHPTTTAFAPIGGYKSMIALGHVAASLHGIPSLYLHEDSQILQEIAPAPFHISPETSSKVSQAAFRIGNGAVFSLLPSEIQSTVESFPTFFRRIDEIIELNELGHFLQLSQLPILLSKSAARTLSKNCKLLTTQLEQIRTHATRDPNASSINHDLVGAPGRNHPWRIAKMGEGIRHLWQIIPNQHILIHTIWTDHDLYNTESVKSIQLPLPNDQDLRDWTPLT